MGELVDPPLSERGYSTFKSWSASQLLAGLASSDAASLISSTEWCDSTTRSQFIPGDAPGWRARKVNCYNFHMKNGPYILAHAPPDFPGKKYRGRYCYEHTLVWWKTHGVLPKKTEILHHRDGNKHNNSPRNIELKTRAEHAKEHNLERKPMEPNVSCSGCGVAFRVRPHRIKLKKFIFHSRSCYRLNAKRVVGRPIPR